MRDFQKKENFDKGCGANSGKNFSKVIEMEKKQLEEERQKLEEEKVDEPIFSYSNRNQELSKPRR